MAARGASGMLLDQFSDADAWSSRSKRLYADEMATNSLMKARKQRSKTDSRAASWPRRRIGSAARRSRPRACSTDWRRNLMSKPNCCRFIRGCPARFNCLHEIKYVRTVVYSIAYFALLLTAAAPLRRRARFRGLVFFVRDHASAGGVDREALRQAGPAQLPQRRGGGPSAPLAALNEADLSPGGSGGRAVALSRRSLRAVRNRGRGREQYRAARTIHLSRAPPAAADAALEPQS